MVLRNRLYPYNAFDIQEDDILLMWQQYTYLNESNISNFALLYY